MHVYAKIQQTAAPASHVRHQSLPDRNMPSKLNIYAIYAKNFMDNMAEVYTYICHILSHCDKQCNKEHTCILHASLNKYGYHTANVGHTATMLYWHTHPKSLHKYAKLKPTATTTLHITVKYAIKTNVPSKLAYCHICKISDGHRSGMCMHICHILSHEHKSWCPGALYSDATATNAGAFWLHRPQSQRKQ